MTESRRAENFDIDGRAIRRRAEETALDRLKADGLGGRGGFARSRKLCGANHQFKRHTTTRHGVLDRPVEPGDDGGVLPAARNKKAGGVS
jgi:hypothetical protein